MQAGRGATLVAGQVVNVNQYTVQVEKYLSQGGFAHVYLVRTPQPVFGTTHHVLKRIAVANAAMLEEVKKEVDIMVSRRAHPSATVHTQTTYSAYTPRPSEHSISHRRVVVPDAQRHDRSVCSHGVLPGRVTLRATPHPIPDELFHRWWNY
jgi:hypothetical protein